MTSPQLSISQRLRPWNSITLGGRALCGRHDSVHRNWLLCLTLKFIWKDRYLSDLWQNVNCGIKVEDVWALTDGSFNFLVYLKMSEKKASSLCSYLEWNLVVPFLPLNFIQAVLKLPVLFSWISLPLWQLFFLFELSPWSANACWPYCQWGSSLDPTPLSGLQQYLSVQSRSLPQPSSIMGSCNCFWHQGSLVTL